MARQGGAGSTQTETLSSAPLTDGPGRRTNTSRIQAHGMSLRTFSGWRNSNPRASRSDGPAGIQRLLPFTWSASFPELYEAAGSCQAGGPLPASALYLYGFGLGIPACGKHGWRLFT